MDENKGFSRLTGEFCNIIVEHAGGSYTNEVDVYDSDKYCAELAEKVAVAFANWYSDRFGPDEEDFREFLKQYEF